MTRRPDDVGQSLGLPDFVDPSDVAEASLDASLTWGEERVARAASDGESVSGLGGRPASRRPSGSGSGSGSTRRAASGSGFGSRQSGRAKGGARGGAKKQLTWAQKQERREKRAEKRREHEAVEREKDPIAFAREIVLTQLTAAPKSRAQLAEKLRAKEVEEGIIEAVLDRMEDVGLVDDEAYAGMLVRSQVASRGLARRALAQELKRKGIDDDAAQVALDQVDDDSERRRALELARKKMRTMTRLDEQAQTRRLAGLLARKGYPSSLVWSVVREVQGSVVPGEES